MDQMKDSWLFLQKKKKKMLKIPPNYSSQESLFLEINISQTVNWTFFGEFFMRYNEYQRLTL